MLQLSDREWAEFRVGELFTVTGSKTTSKIELEASGIGKYPYVTTKATNNAVDGLYSIATEKGNVIVIESAVNGYVTYQEMDFSASAHVEKLIPKFEMNRYSGVFIVNIIRVLTNGIYNYGHKFNQKRIKDTIIKLPITSDGLPDYQFMHDYIAEREPDYSWTTQCIEPNAEISLTDREWAEFRVGDLFNVFCGKVTTVDKSGSKFPIVSACTTNNAIIGYTDDESKLLNGNCLTIGQQTAFCTYQGNKFVATNNVDVLVPIDTILNKNTGLFLCTVINNEINGKFNYGRKLSASRAVEVKINLPITQDGTPDYDFMAQYIKSLPFSKVLEAVTL